MNPDDFKSLVKAGLNNDQIALVMEMMDRDTKKYAEAEEARKAKGRERIARWRLERRNVTVQLPNVTDTLTGADAHVEDKTSNLEIEPQVKEERQKRASALDVFWPEYPHRVGKADASKALDRALKRADLETIMAGLRRYVAKTDDRPWCNPATWLNQDRWTDEPAPPVARAGPFPNRPPNASDILKSQRENFHDDAPPNRPYLALAR